MTSSYGSNYRQSRRDQDELTKQAALDAAEEASGDSDGQLLDTIGKVGAIAGGVAAAAFGANKLRKALKPDLTAQINAYVKTPQYQKDLKTRISQDRAAVSQMRSERPTGIKQVDLSQIEDSFSAPQFQGPRQPQGVEKPRGSKLPPADPQKSYADPQTGARQPSVSEFNEMQAGSSRPDRAQQNLKEYLAEPLGQMGTPRERPADSGVESYVLSRRQQADPVDRLSAELEGDFQAQRVREVKEELGGQVLDQLQQEGKQQRSFSQDYLKKQGYVDDRPQKLDVAAGSDPVRVQSTDSMDVDGYQEHREIKRSLQRNEDLDIGAITAKTEPNFGTANPEQVDNAIERVASNVQEGAVRERSGSGVSTSNVFEQMQENVDDDAQNFARQYMERREMKTAQQASKPPSRRIDVESPQEVAMREGAMKSVEPRDLADSPLPERTVSNFGPDAKISGAASNTSIRGTSRIDDRTRSIEPTRQIDANPDVGGLTQPVPSQSADEMMPVQQQYGERGNYPEGVKPRPSFTPGLGARYEGQPDKAIQATMGRAAAGTDPYAVKQRETDLGGGMGIYGQEQQFAAGPQSRQTGDYTATAGRVPSQVFSKDLDLKTPSGKPFANPVTVEGASPKQTRIAPEYDRMSDQTLENVASQSKGPSAQKLSNELERRKTARASMQASDRIREINRSNPPEKAQQMVRDFLSGFGS